MKNLVDFLISQRYNSSMETLRNRNGIEMKKAVFLMGAPASGKSTIREKLFFNIPAIDCDEIKKLHPKYDPKDITNEVHYWSTDQAKKMMTRMIEEGQSFSYDTTGACAEALIRAINKVKAAGYETLLVYVKCGLRECLRRNRMRTRTVKPFIVRNKWEEVGISYEIIRKYVDDTLIVRSRDFNMEG